MKHPALTRAMAAVLAIMCAIMLICGAVGIGDAQKEYKEDLDAYEKLSERIATFKELSAKLDGEDSYKETKEKLDARQEEHDKESADFRTDLAERTATQGGYQQGANALLEAREATEAAYRQYADGVAQFQAAEAEFNAKMAQLDALPGQADIVAQKCAQAAMLNPAHPGEAPIEPIAPQMPNEPVAPGEGATEEELTNYAAELESYNNAMLTYNTALADYQTQKTQYDAAIGEYNAKLSVYTEQMTAINTAVGSANAILSAIGASASDPGQAAAMLAEVNEASVAGIKAAAQQELNAAKAELDAAGEAVMSAKHQVQGGLEQIWYDLGEMELEEPELEEKRKALLEEAEQLEKDKEAAEQKKEDERVLASTRAALKNYDGVAAFMAENDDLAACAEEYAAQFDRELHNDRTARIAIALCELIGGLVGFACLPSAYEKSKSRFLLLAPSALSFVLAAAGLGIALYFAFGMNYAVLPVLIFAPIYLLCAAPRNKYPAASE